MKSKSRMKMRMEIEKLFLAKQKRRMELARLPIERKVRILASLQRVAGKIRLEKHSPGRPW